MIRYLTSILAIGILCASSVFAADEIETEALKLEHELMAPCCYGGTIAGHESGIVKQIRADIRERLKQGMTSQQIKDAYVEQFGTQILAAPPTKGFHVMAYTLPPVLLGIALLALMLVFKRSKRRPQPVPVKIDPKLVERIERDLHH